MHLVSSIVRWLLYFILIWQGVCHVSDNGLAWLLRFLLQFFKAINVHVPADILTELIAIFPTSLFMGRQLLDLDRDNFTKYVVCPKCTTCYDYNQCVVNVNGRHVVKRCATTFYSRGKSQPCNAQLVKKVTLKNNVSKYYPIYYYCYTGIINSLEKLVQKNGFPEKCEEWRSRGHGDGDLLTDVYDAKLWKDFMKYENVDFLNTPRNYGLMLNFDFFQPMKHRKDYSVGVLYLVLLNLPRAERFKWENVIVVGIIPAMGHEPKTLNTFLKPAVGELKALWKGVRLSSSISKIPLQFRAALMCTSSDIPASRKLCGFKGHSAEMGCSRCLKKFPGNFGEKRDYAGYQRENWVKRKSNDHRRQAKKIQKCKTKSEATKLSKQYGINYFSTLLELDYFDIVRFCSIDPMHNLFLGTAKYVFKHWVSEGYLNKQQLQTIENRIEEMEVPVEIGRLPKAISSNYGSYTAEQWKNWSLIYSLHALKDILSDQHFKCWQTFVLACRYLCKPVLCPDDIARADMLLLKFCKGSQALYGSSYCTPNMHLHCHLNEVITDYGPIHCFWCFSFERYNGILGSITTNNRSIELQIMRKLTTLRFLDNISLNQDFEPFFGDVISSLTTSTTPFGEHSPPTMKLTELLEFFQMDAKMPLSEIKWQNMCAVLLPSHYKETHFDSSDIDVLLQVYQVMFPDRHILLEHLSRSLNKYGTIEIFGQAFGSKMAYRSKRSTGILAAWPRPDGGIDLNSNELSFGLVDFYFSHSLKQCAGEFTKHLFACVTWYQATNDTIYHDVNPLHLASMVDSFPGGPSRFMPVQRISAKCAFAVGKNDRNVGRYIVSPMTQHFVS